MSNINETQLRSNIIQDKLDGLERDEKFLENFSWQT
jgi:hypothetical protein